MTSTEKACKVAVLTVSDRCFHEVYEDKSGAWLKNAVLQPTGESASIIGAVAAYKIVPDEQQAIVETLTEWCDNGVADIILTSGGTGFTQRDVTPEATAAVIERHVPSIPAIMATKFYPLSLYSRQIAGVRKRTLIVNLPGSTNGVRECYELIQPVLNHICQQLRDDTRSVRAFHGESPKQQISTSVAAEPKTTSINHRHHHCSHKNHTDNNVNAGSSRVDVSNIAGRSRKSPFPLIEVSDALSLVLEHATVSQPVSKDAKLDADSEFIEEVTLQNALHRCCACNIHAREPLPPFPASIKDGYAVIASDGFGACRVVGENSAGDNIEADGGKVLPGTCIRVNTGAPIPPGADAVVQVEDTRLIHASDDGKLELKIEILVPPKVGQDIRPIGSDIKVGTLVLAQNQQISVWDLGVLATCGVTRIPVFKQPRIALISTGNELVPPDSEVLPPGCIRNANETSLRALLTAHNYADGIVHTDIARDTPNDTCRAFRQAFSAGADVVISSGGVSMGDRDVVRQVLQQDFGATIHFAQVRMKPGKPTTFATCEFEGRKKLVFGLPGNPVSALVTAYLYVLPALRKMSGETAEFQARTLQCVCRERIKLDPRPEYHRAMLSGETDGVSGLPIACSTGNQISSRLLSFSNAQVLLMLPAANETKQWIEVGERITAMVL